MATLHGFYKLTRHQRLARLVAMGLLTSKEARHFTSVKKLPWSLAEKFIENVVGYYQIPLGIAVNFRIDHRDYMIPMAVEETSIIAAASKTAEWIKQRGEIVTKTLGKQAIGQIQLAKVKDFDQVKKNIQQHKQQLIDDVNSTIAISMVKRGGGIKDIRVRKVSRGDGKQMAVVHLLIETCDAMGANIINQICEYLRSPIEALTQETVSLCILSNLTDGKLTRAEIVLNEIDPKLGNAIAEASLFAQCDPYRAATNNKGVLNGMDPVTIATGNDWRAVEAGVHAYAARSEKYSSITRWTMQGNKLVGNLEAPINVGTAGGVTRLHPTANLCLKILGVEKAEQLARIIAAVGLVQNLGALRALVTEGICRGHMRLHLSNICMAADARPDEIAELKQQLEKILAANKPVSVTDAVRALKKIRRKKN